MGEAAALPGHPAIQPVQISKILVSKIKNNKLVALS